MSLNIVTALLTVYPSLTTKLANMWVKKVRSSLKKVYTSADLYQGVTEDGRIV
jgi:hypothetical protein